MKFFVEFRIIKEIVMEAEKRKNPDFLYLTFQQIAEAHREIVKIRKLDPQIDSKCYRLLMLLSFDSEQNWRKKVLMAEKESQKKKLQVEICEMSLKRKTFSKWKKSFLNRKDNHELILWKNRPSSTSDSFASLNSSLSFIRFFSFFFLS